MADSKANPGDIRIIDGEEYWCEPDGYQVKMKFVRKYPALFGPLAVNPDGDQGDVEISDAFQKIIEKLMGYGATYSTWAERHCSVTALAIGHDDVKTSDDVPPCPKFWIKENQYWVTHIALGREIEKAKITDTLAGLLANKKVLAIIAAALAGGTFAGPEILTVIKSLFGIA